MHSTTFDYLQPTADQIETMTRVRHAAKIYSDTLERELPDGADKSYVLRAHRQTAMWANVAITRWDNGAPRK